MEALGAVVNVVTLVERIIKTYRHIAASSSFAAEAATLAAMISFEYFRFETWADQSSYLLIDDGVAPTASSRVASSATPSKYELQMAEKTLEVVAQISPVLDDICTLLVKYNMFETSTETDIAPPKHPSTVQVPALDGRDKSVKELSLPATAGSNQGVKIASEKLSRMRVRLDHETARLRKINFGWGLRNEISDKKRLQELIQQLKYWNDALRENMPIVDQRFNEVVTQVRVVSLANNYADCEGIGKSSGVIGGPLYEDIQLAAKMKGQRLASEPGGGAEDEYVSPTNMSLLPRFQADCHSVVDYPLTTLHSERNDTTELRRVVVEAVNFGSHLSFDQLTILEDRIKQLARLLEEDSRPTSLLLPTCAGYVKSSSSEFGILYQLPPKADPIKRPRTLFSMIPANQHTPKRLNQLTVLPTLEERYRLAKLLAEGMLVLHSISWLHKSLNSNNIVFFHDDDGFDISKPLMLGFGLGRSSERTTETVDLRHISSEFEIYQHPDLRADGHKRYEKRYDIYSLGLVLLEIGLWQSIYYFKQKDQDAQEFRRKVRNVCQTHLAHLMGKSYQRAVLLCIDDDEIWKESPDDDDAAAKVQEIFSWKVLRELGNCL